MPNSGKRLMRRTQQWHSHARLPKAESPVELEEPQTTVQSPKLEIPRTGKRWIARRIEWRTAEEQVGRMQTKLAWRTQPSSCQA